MNPNDCDAKGRSNGTDVSPSRHRSHGFDVRQGGPTLNWASRSRSSGGSSFLRTCERQASESKEEQGQMKWMTRRHALQFGLGAGFSAAVPRSGRAAAQHAVKSGTLIKYVEPVPVAGNGIVVATPSGTTTYSFTQTLISRQPHPQLPPTPVWAYDDGSGVGAVRLDRNGGRCAERHSAHGAIHARTPGHAPGMAPGGYAADAAGRRSAPHDPPPRRIRGGGQRRQSRGDPQRIRSGRDADGLLHQPAAAIAGLVAVIPRPRPRNRPTERLRRPRRRLHPAGRVRCRRGAESDRNPRRRLRDSPRHPGPPVQPGRDVPIPGQRHRRRDLDRGVLRRHHAGKRQDLAVPGDRAAEGSIPRRSRPGRCSRPLPKSATSRTPSRRTPGPSPPSGPSSSCPRA